MKAAVLAAALLVLPHGLSAQETEVPDQVQSEVGHGTGAVLRGLDKVDGQIVDMILANGMTADIGRLNVELLECRYPAGDSSADAYALMTIRRIDNKKVIFSGWMLASSPALNPLEHPRYDVWVLRCRTE